MKLSNLLMQYKLSPSVLSLMKECPRCFWLAPWLHQEQQRQQQEQRRASGHSRSGPLKHHKYATLNLGRSTTRFTWTCGP
jgi:hypothetical protein